MIALCGFAVLAAYLSFTVKSQSTGGVFTAVAAAVCIAVYTLTKISPVADFIKTSLGSVGTEAFSVICKSFGIGYLSSLACDICDSAGEKALSHQLEISGKCAIVLLALPLAAKLLDYVSSFD